MRSVTKSNTKHHDPAAAERTGECAEKTAMRTGSSSSACTATTAASSSLPQQQQEHQATTTTTEEDNDQQEDAPRTSLLTTPLLLQERERAHRDGMLFPSSSVRPSLLQSWFHTSATGKTGAMPTVFGTATTATKAKRRGTDAANKKTNASVGAAFANATTATTAARGTPTAAEEEDDLAAVGRFLRRGTLVAWALWMVLMFVTFRYAPADSFQHLTPGELKSTSVMIILLVVTNGSRLLPLAMQHDNSLQFLKSGILAGSFSVQFIALVSNLTMALLPTPIMEDPMSGMRIHLVRYAAWVPLCFLMSK